MSEAVTLFFFFFYGRTGAVAVKNTSFFFPSPLYIRKNTVPMRGHECGMIRKHIQIVQLLEDLGETGASEYACM